MTTYCVALIGGIGSGKSSAAHFFNDFGVEVFSADNIAKTLSEQETIKQKIRSTFGDGVFTDRNELNRKALARIIFSNTEKKKSLENILHPLVRKEIQKKITLSSAPYCLIEIPVFEKREDYPYLNRILCIKTNTQKQIAQTMLRDNKTSQEIKQILTQQISDKERELLADDVIKNNGTLEKLKCQCLKLHKTYLSLSKDVTK